MRKIIIIFAVTIAIAFPQLANCEDSAAGQAKVMTVLGSSLGANLYFAYTMVGVFADAFEKKVYSQKDIEKFIKLNDAWLISIETYLQDSLTGYKYAKIDSDFINSTITAFQQIQTMSKALLAYTLDKSSKNTSDLTTARDKAYGMLEKLIGIQ